METNHYIHLKAEQEKKNTEQQPETFEDDFLNQPQQKSENDSVEDIMLKSSFYVYSKRPKEVELNPNEKNDQVTEKASNLNGNHQINIEKESNQEVPKTEELIKKSPNKLENLAPYHPRCISKDNKVPLRSRRRKKITITNLEEANQAKNVSRRDKALEIKSLFFMKGEYLIALFYNIILINKRDQIARKGYLYVTNYRIRFHDEIQESDTESHWNNDYEKSPQPMKRATLNMDNPYKDLVTNRSKRNTTPTFLSPIKQNPYELESSSSRMLTSVSHNYFFMENLKSTAYMKEAEEQTEQLTKFLENVEDISSDTPSTPQALTNLNIFKRQKLRQASDHFVKLIDVEQTMYSNILDICMSKDANDVSLLCITCKDAHHMWFKPDPLIYYDQFDVTSHSTEKSVPKPNNALLSVSKIMNCLYYLLQKHVEPHAKNTPVCAYTYRKHVLLGAPSNLNDMLVERYFDAVDSTPTPAIEKPTYYDSVYYINSKPIRFLNACIPSISGGYSQRELDSGWLVYDHLAEFKRLGVESSGKWRITKINENYHFCATYPRSLVVPASVPDDLLHVVKTYRSKNRIPVLTWLHPTNGASLFRCSQPLTGVTFNHVKEDSKLLEAIYDTLQKPLLIIDCRPLWNSYANQLMGKGHENMNHYKFAKLTHLGIHNIHAMTLSLQKLTRACEHPHSESFLSSIDNSGWINHIQLIFKGVVQVIEQMEQVGGPVLIHCSDGWDRTSQLCSLASLCMDPFYRTLKGFQVLIEKDWMSFGHCFSTRLGFLRTSDKSSPVFLQFLDCVHYLLLQYPQAFEFNGDFLIAIMDGALSGLYGNFLVDSEHDRRASSLPRLTVSLWSFLSRHKALFLNDLYLPSSSSSSFPDVLLPDMSFSSLSLSLWTDYYCRYQRSRLKPPHHAIREKNMDLQAELHILRRQLHEQSKLSNALVNKFYEVVPHLPPLLSHDASQFLQSPQIFNQFHDPMSLSSTLSSSMLRSDQSSFLQSSGSLAFKNINLDFF